MVPSHDRFHSPLIKTRLSPPQRRTSLVPRPRLLDLLSETGCRTLTLICAPAGYGKTTLLLEWIASNEKPANRPKPAICWLSLDAAGNDPILFLSYLIHALESSNLQIGSEASEVLGSFPSIPFQTILGVLINRLCEVTDPIYLVLDDYQFITNATIHEGLAFFLERLPGTVHVLIATRSDPPLPLARLRVRNQLTEVRAEALRFTQEETNIFLNDLMNLSLSVENMKILENRTEGWIAGLQMAALAMQSLSRQGREGFPRFIEAFSGTNRYILDYLIEEVLAGQTPEVQRFLLYTSVLERLSAPLCDAVLTGWDEAAGSASSQTIRPSRSILEYLDRANLFLVPLDTERTWYRYHHLFADLLRARLEQAAGAGEIARLHERAARWYEQNGMTYEAIYHASLTSNEEWVEHLIEDNYIEVFRRRETASIRFLTGRLSQDLVYRRPWLCIYKAESHAWFGELDEAEMLLAAAENHIHSRTSDAETRAMLGYLCYVKSRITGMRGDLNKAIELGYTARDHTPAENQAVQGPIGAFLGFAHFLDGDLSRSIQLFDETIRAGIAAGVVSSTMGAYCALARVYAVLGRLHKSYEVYEDALKFFQASGSANAGAVGIVQAGMASLLYEWNDLEAAHQRIRQGIELLPYWNKADDTALAYLTLARIYEAQGNAAAAQESIEKAARFVRASGTFSETRHALVAAEIRLKLAQSQLAEAGWWASSIEKSLFAEESFRFEDERLRLTLARVSLAQEKWEAAAGLLSRLEVEARRDGRVGSQVEILALEALAEHGRGDGERAAALFTQSLALAESEGYLRIFADEGERMRRMLASWLARAGVSPLQAYAARLLACIDAALPETAPTRVERFPPGSQIEPLSRRELEVLQLMAEGRTNPEIANRLVVAPGTVKAHAASIYRKLDAANRTEAVTRARQLGILP